MAEQEHAPGKAQPPDPFLEQPALGPFARAEELEPGKRARKERGRFEQRAVALHRPEIPDHRHRNVPGLDREGRL